MVEDREGGEREERMNESRTRGREEGSQSCMYTGRERKEKDIQRDHERNEVRKR